MPEVVVTRGGQITLTKDVRDRLRIREGDSINLNLIGEGVFITKRNPKIFDTHDFLPDNFEKVLSSIRAGSFPKRLKRLGIVP